AVAFCESMAFMVDNTNFRALPPDQQEELIRTMPVFQKDPRQAGRKLATGAYAAASKPSGPDTAQVLGRLFSSF
ncbi:MAG TPA: social motility and stimulation tgl protein, partial [Myxococcales bacterium]|nr:social motility and stimulation tgl protein [Myxococcales bacterium]